MSTSDMKKAREWAEWADKKLGVAESHANALAAAEVIQSLPDHWIDADKLRQIIDFQGTSISEEARKDLESLLTPPLPTLADLIEAGNDPHQYQWMQAEHIEHGRVIITHPGSTYIYYMKTSGLSGGVSHSGADRITPLPDLPRLEWPAEEPVAIPQEPYLFGGHGPTEREQDPEWADRFMEEPVAELTRPKDVPAGEVWIVLCGGKKWVGVRTDNPTRPWSITRPYGLDYQNVADSEITLVSRLVQEVKP